jgi:prepilin-type N-terminal cleavage/methylation domain-containing protein
MKKKAFTVIELLVVISVITVLMAVLLPVLSRVRKVARATRCLSNTRQLGLALHSGADDTGGLVLPSYDLPWWEPLRDHFDSNDTFLCPEARKPGPQMYVERTPYEAWEILRYPIQAHFICSYGVNAWLVGTLRMRELAKTQGWNDIDDFRTFSRRHWYWTGHNLDTPSLVPLMTDCVWEGATPEETDKPPSFHGDFVVQGIGTMQWNRNINQMRAVCLDRHAGRTSMTFMDGSSRPVGIKELWTLKWYRGCPSAGPWTVAGGVQPEDWPAWMRKFKDY